MTHQPHHPCHLSILATACLIGTAHAQTATLIVSHDHPTGLVQPGESVRITASVTWSGAYQLARVAGDALAQPDVGIAGAGSGNVGAGPLVHFGTPVGGSVHGVDVGSGPPAGFFLYPLFYEQPVPFLMYDWTAPGSPGVVRFDWRPSSTMPEVQVYLSITSVASTPVPTTYLGTSITVIPAPASAAALFLAGAIVSRRRRRP